jgi:hypothetical protein
MMDILEQVLYHYSQWTDDMQHRLTRTNGWNDIVDAYWGKLPLNWPYTSRVVDPRIRTSLIEKTARLLNSKLRGRLIPREGGDVLKAKLNNAILDFQWDNAEFKGSMLSKWAQMDSDTRLFGSKFAEVLWKVVKDKDGNTTFEGNEFVPLDIRDCGIDLTSAGIKDAKWFQKREWVTIEELKQQNKGGVFKYKNLDQLEASMGNGGDRRDSRYVSRLKSLKGVQDYVGADRVFPQIEKVTEFRQDKWIIFAPQHKVILAEIDNPYAHKKIPIVQLRYYPLQDDPIGESEVEPVLSLWRGIQACVCGFIDAMQVDVNPPLKILEGQARIETIVYGPRAQWIMDNPNAVTQTEPSRSAIQYFQATYPALVSAFNTAMGDFSQGVSNIDPTANQKTATEVKASQRQQLSRDQKNQTDLAEAIQDMMKMWQANNRQFLFSDPEKQTYIFKIVGRENFEYFKRSGLDEMDVPTEVMSEIQNIITAQQGNVSDDDIQQMLEAGKVPRYPVESGKGKKKTIVPKMQLNDMGDQATISLTPEDVDGDFDFVADVKSMAAGAGQDALDSMQRAVDLITSPNITGLLVQEGVKPKVKDLVINLLEQYGTQDASRFFEDVQSPSPVGAVPQPDVFGQTTGMQGASASLPPEQMAEQMAGPNVMPQPEGIPAPIQP